MLSDNARIHLPVPCIVKLPVLLHEDLHRQELAVVQCECLGGKLGIHASDRLFVLENCHIPKLLRHLRLDDVSIRIFTRPNFCLIFDMQKQEDLVFPAGLES